MKPDEIKDECGKTGCGSQINLWWPEFRFWPLGYSPDSIDPCRMTFQLLVCVKHHADFQDKNQALLCSIINKDLKKRGLVLLDVNSCVVEWTRHVPGKDTHPNLKPLSTSQGPVQ